MEYTITDGVYGFLFAFIISVGVGYFIIPMLHRLKFGQNVRTDGPKAHLQKTGTPTMGGIMFLVSLVITSLVFRTHHTDSFALIFIIIGYGIIGFIDDYLKIIKKSSDGLSALQKILCQLIVTTVFLYYLITYVPDFSSIYIPFTTMTINLGLVLYVPFFYIVMLGTVNAVNLTDGLDGLAGGVTLLVTIFFAYASMMAKNDIFITSWILGGGLAGFLVYNSKPAKVFMGDTGSLALGGYVAGIAFILRMPIFIAIVGLVYLVEAISVMIQVSYFKYTKKKYNEGRRVFKMAPYHHHLEESGYAETKIVALFYIATAILCLIGFLGSKNIFM